MPIVRSFDVVRPSRCCPNEVVAVRRYVATERSPEVNVFTGLGAKSQDVVEFKALVKMLGAQDEFRFKRVGLIGSSSPLGQALQSIGSYALPGNISPYRSPVRSAVFGALTPGGGGGRRGSRPARSARCPEGYQYGGRFTDNRFSTCGAKLFDIPSPLQIAAGIIRALRRADDISVDQSLEGSPLTPGEYGSSVIDSRKPQIPRVSEPNPELKQQQVDNLIRQMGEPGIDAQRMVRRDGFILEPVVSPKVLRAIPDNRDMEGATYLLTSNGVPSLGGEELGLLSNTGVTRLVYVLPGGSSFSLEKVRPLTVGERRKLGRTVNSAAQIDNSENPAARLMAVAEQTGDGIKYSENFIGIENPRKRIQARNGKTTDNWVRQIFGRANAQKPAPTGRDSASESQIGNRITSLDMAVDHIAGGGSLAKVAPAVLQEALKRVNLFKKRDLGRNERIYFGPANRTYAAKIPDRDFEHLDALLVSDFQQHLGLESPDVYIAGNGSRREYLRDTTSNVYPGKSVSPERKLQDVSPQDMAAMLVSDIVTGETNRMPLSLDMVDLNDRTTIVATSNRPELTPLAKLSIRNRTEQLIKEMTSVAGDGLYGKYYRELKEAQRRQFLAMIDKLIAKARDFSFMNYKKRIMMDGDLSEAELAHLDIINQIAGQRVEVLENASKAIRKALGGK